MTETKDYGTDQERFWAGEFGSAYIGRNQGAGLHASNLAFFSRCLRSAAPISSCIEFGANIGMNLRALQQLLPTAKLEGIEINKDAATELGAAIGAANVHNASILDFAPGRRWDLVLIKGVLIHINPDALSQVYESLTSATGRYLLVAEYYNPSPVAVPYRGHADRLFKRDFAGEILDAYPEFRLGDYGFAYRRDPLFPQDDITWFLLERN